MVYTRGFNGKKMGNQVSLLHYHNDTGTGEDNYMDEQFLSPLEVAEILQVKKNTVYEMIKRGDLKATKMGKQFRIARKDVYEYMGSDARKRSLRRIS